MVILRRLAGEVGVNPSAFRKRALKLGVRLEKRWVRSPQGTKQITLITDRAGEAALRDWYRDEIT